MKTLASLSLVTLLSLVACGDDTANVGGSPATGGGGNGNGGDPPVAGNANGGEGGQGGTPEEGGAGGEGPSKPLDITLEFEARVGADPADCASSYSNFGAEDSQVDLKDLRFYVHDVRLVDSEDNEVPLELEQDGIWQVENVALLDFEDGTNGCVDGNSELRKTIVGQIPAGDYVGLKFRLGVPFDLNHEDVATSPSPLNVTTLFWNWGFGHIFFSAVTTADASKGTNDHFVHLGSVGCTGDPELGEVVSCTNPNRPEFSFDGFDPDNSVVVLDLEPLLSESNLESEIGCHSFPDTDACVAPFTALGIDYATGAMTPETQTVFSIE